MDFNIPDNIYDRDNLQYKEWLNYFSEQRSSYPFDENIMTDVLRFQSFCEKVTPHELYEIGKIRFYMESFVPDDFDVRYARKYFDFMMICDVYLRVGQEYLLGYLKRGWIPRDEVCALVSSCFFGELPKNFSFQTLEKV